MVVTVAVGDIHGRFRRVLEWLERLEERLQRPADAVFAVGDVEAFLSDGSDGRKATKRMMPAELAACLEEGRLPRSLEFIGGNNEDFQALHRLKEGGEVVPGLRYLGRVGTVERAGLRVAFLSGIYAPRRYQSPLIEPRSTESRKQAGYFRAEEVERLGAAEDVDLMLVHEWPRGIVPRRAQAEAAGVPRIPWIGNPVTRTLVDTLRPRWLFCGHSHQPNAATLTHPSGAQTHITCLDQATRPEGSIFWIEWAGREPVRAGWGVEGHECWRRGGCWDVTRIAPARAAPP